jgi:hypothetical protein
MMSVFVALLLLLYAISAQAAMLQISDVERLRALKTKLVTAQVDISDAIENAGQLKNHVVADCLFMVHMQADDVSSTAATVSTLVALSLLMKDSGDEFQVLRALRPYLSAMSDQLPHARKQINAWMTRCSDSATVNVKAQAVLNILAEFEGPVASLSRRVIQVVQPKQ